LTQHIVEPANATQQGPGGRALPRAPRHFLVVKEATPSPRVVTVDSKGNVYVVQSGGNGITRIAPRGLVTNLPGAVAAPKRIAVDAEDNLLIADTETDRVRRYVFGSGIVLVADGLSRPHGVFEDQMRRMYIADSGNNRVVRIER
jgi:serine/threonine-protein kinase